MPDCVKQSFASNGFRAPFQGLGPTLLRNIPANSVYLGSFEVMKIEAAKSYKCSVPELPAWVVLSAAGANARAARSSALLHLHQRLFPAAACSEPFAASARSVVQIFRQAPQSDCQSIYTSCVAIATLDPRICDVACMWHNRQLALTRCGHVRMANGDGRIVPVATVAAGHDAATPLLPRRGRASVSPHERRMHERQAWGTAPSTCRGLSGCGVQGSGG